MTDMEKYLKKYENKNVWMCDFFATRINLQEPLLSLCHDTYVGQQIIGDLLNYSPDRYYKRLAEILDDNEQSLNAHCRQCEKCKRQKFEYRKLNWITINTSWYCNSSCIYCAGHFASEDDGHEVISIIKKFHDQGLFDTNCLFDWGCGEPTLNPIFEETVKWITDHRYLQRINTNGILYSKTAEYALRSGHTGLRLSLDSGTESCFKKVKGHSGYNEVWNNIARYRKVSSNIYLKYNVFNYNSDLSEIDAFLDNCLKAKINNIIIDGEVTSYQPQNNAGPFYYTKKEFEAMHYLQEKALERGFNVSISDYAFSYRAEYDEKGNLTLPSKFIDNIDRTIICNEIYVSTEPSVNALIEYIVKCRKKIIIRGYGNDGKMLLKIFNSKGIKVAYIVDKKMEEVSGIQFLPEKDWLQDDDEAIVMLASSLYWKDFLKEINIADKKNFEPMYMHGFYYYKFIESEGIE